MARQCNSSNNKSAVVRSLGLYRIDIVLPRLFNFQSTRGPSETAEHDTRPDVKTTTRRSGRWLPKVRTPVGWGWDVGRWVGPNKNGERKHATTHIGFGKKYDRDYQQPWNSGQFGISLWHNLILWSALAESYPVDSIFDHQGADLVIRSCLSSVG